jgi:hypothetical protein
MSTVNGKVKAMSIVKGKAGGKEIESIAGCECKELVSM